MKAMESLDVKKRMFRGLNRVSKDWVYGFPRFCYPGLCKDEAVIENNDIGAPLMIVYRDSLGQCIGGMADSTDKLIFEGDYLRDGRTDKIYLVEWNEDVAAWVARDMNDGRCEISDLVSQSLTIIGNKFEGLDFLMSISEAVKKMKEGYKVRRSAWEKGEYAWYDVDHTELDGLVSKPCIMRYSPWALKGNDKYVPTGEDVLVNDWEVADNVKHIPSSRERLIVDKMDEENKKERESCLKK